MSATVLAPTLAEIEAGDALIAPYIERTPVIRWRGPEIEALLGENSEIFVKLELFQRSGTFKLRGALSNMIPLGAAERALGVTAVSAGNHAVAVACAASLLGISAKLVMQSSANPARVEAARSYGADVILGGDGPACFALARKIADDEGRTFVHPFEGKGVSIGTGTLGLEFAREVDALDMLILPVGGGGLAGGTATAVKMVHPLCLAFGVEPEGADSMNRSFAAGEPVTLDKVSTVADSLAPPMALPYSFGLCRQAIDHMLTVSDAEILAATKLIFSGLKLAVEPAAAAATAALVGPLRERGRGKRIGIIMCGTNIDLPTYFRLLGAGDAA